MAKVTTPYLEIVDPNSIVESSKSVVADDDFFVL